jgi:excisionase family DNA binding protein
MAKLLTVPEVAERLRVSVWTVYKLVEQQKLRAIRLTPGKLLFSEAIIEATIRQAQDPTAAGGGFLTESPHAPRT